MRTLQVSVAKIGNRNYSVNYTIFENEEVTDESTPMMVESIKEAKEFIRSEFKGVRFSGGRTFIVL